jgi:alkylation response protein AidB-like acyl-CoA dehydrogenase
MALSNPQNDKHNQHSIVVVPLNTPGIKIKRMLQAYGDYDAPFGHGEMHFTNVRVPKENLLVGMGKGFAIAQGRLSLTVFGKPLMMLGGNRERVAEARIAIEQARLLTLQAAWEIDNIGVRNAMVDISAIKVAVPKMLEEAIDMAIQIHGGAGMCNDFPLARLAAGARSLRLADGPDEVHKAMVARLEIKKYQ